MNYYTAVNYAAPEETYCEGSLRIALWKAVNRGSGTVILCDSREVARCVARPVRTGDSSHVLNGCSGYTEALLMVPMPDANPEERASILRDTFGADLVEPTKGNINGKG